jgi:hypothetical protein
MTTASLPVSAAPAAPRLAKRDKWLVSPFYDLTFIIFSSVLILFPHVTHSIFESNIAVDLIVTMLIGGPHLFATYTMTVMEPGFRARYPRYARGALLLPVIIVTLAVINLTLLVTLFFFWASLHVIHQAAFVADAYRFKDPRGWTRWSQVIDYGLLFTSIYPIASTKLMQQEFVTGGRVLLFPEFLKVTWFPWLIWAVFAGFAVAFVAKSVSEYREGRLHGPKTLHMVLATALFALTPTLDNLDVAFQGLNVWHSFQYLAVVLYLNQLRSERGMIGNHLVHQVSKRGYRLYGLCLAFTLGAGVAFLGVLAIVVRYGWFATGHTMGSLLNGQVYADQHYFAFYSVVLSFLLIHYYFDHFLFLHRDRTITPVFAPLATE